jgi:putative salt-induced outer membrane protein YdiY
MLRGKIVLWGFVGLLSLAGVSVRADELETKSGERLTGRILKETADYVEFESAAFGKLRVEREAIVRLDRDGKPQQAASTASTPGQAVPAASPAGQAVASVPAATPASTSAPSSPEAAGANPASQPQQAKNVPEDKTIKFFDRINVLKTWDSRLTFGIAYRRGQDSDNNIDARFRSEKTVPQVRSYLIEARYYRKDNVSPEGEKTVDDDNSFSEFRFRQALRRRQSIRPRWFLQSNSRYYRDPMVNLLHEVTQTGGIGYLVVDRTRVKLSVIPAAGIQYADYGPEESGLHFVAGAYQDFQWDLTKALKILESVYFFQDPFNVGTHALRFHLEQVQMMTRHLSMGIAYDYTFDGQVGKPVKQNQQRLGVSLGLVF